MIKKSISLLSSLHESYLLNKDERFLSITSELSNSIIKIYSEEIKKNISPKVLSDMIKNIEGIDSIKDVVLQILNGQIKLEYTIKDKTLTPIGDTGRLIAYDAHKSINAKNLIVALYMSLYISPEVKLNIFGDNQFFKLADTVTPNDRTVAQDLLDFNKSLRGTSLSNLLEVKDGDAARTKIINNIKKINDGIATERVSEVDKPVASPAKTTELTPPSLITKQECNIAFESGVNLGIAKFTSYKSELNDGENVVNKTIVPLMDKVKEELYDNIVQNKIPTTIKNVSEFTEACYIAVALTIVSYDDDEIQKYIAKMDFNFSNWEKIESLTEYLNKHFHKGWGGMDSKKAETIYRLINPILIQNIINAIPEEYKQQLAGFINDLKNGKLTDIYNFCNKYGSVIGIIDSAKLSQVDFVLRKISGMDTSTCSRLIMQRIEGHAHFLQTAEYPLFVEPLKKMKEIEKFQPGYKKQIENVKRIEPNTPVQNWVQPDTIKIAGAYLYKLYLLSNEISE